MVNFVKFHVNSEFPNFSRGRVSDPAGISHPTLVFIHPTTRNRKNAPSCEGRRSLFGEAAARIIGGNFSTFTPTISLLPKEPQQSRRRNYMKIILPVAGKGERMRPYTNNLPKCLLPVGGKTIID